MLLLELVALMQGALQRGLHHAGVLQELLVPLLLLLLLESEGLALLLQVDGLGLGLDQLVALLPWRLPLGLHQQQPCLQISPLLLLQAALLELTFEVGAFAAVDLLQPQLDLAQLLHGGF